MPMSAVEVKPDKRLEGLVAERFGRSIEGVRAYFGQHAHAVAECAVAMADRFWDGATLLVVGEGPAVSDAQHTAVEFVHPVLPGCRALPSLALSNDIAVTSAYLESEAADHRYAFPLRLLAAEHDIVIAFSAGRLSRAALAALDEARRLRLLTVALTGPAGAESPADFVFAAPTEDPFIVQELQIATYHVLFEFIHIALNHRGIPEAAP